MFVCTYFLQIHLFGEIIVELAITLSNEKYSTSWPMQQYDTVKHAQLTHTTSESTGNFVHKLCFVLPTEICHKNGSPNGPLIHNMTQANRACFKI